MGTGTGTRTGGLHGHSHVHGHWCKLQFNINPTTVSSRILLTRLTHFIPPWGDVLGDGVMLSYKQCSRERRHVYIQVALAGTSTGTSTRAVGCASTDSNTGIDTVISRSGKHMYGLIHVCIRTHMHSCTHELPTSCTRAS